MFILWYNISSPIGGIVPWEEKQVSSPFQKNDSGSIHNSGLNRSGPTNCFEVITLIMCEFQRLRFGHHSHPPSGDENIIPQIVNLV